MNKIYWPLLALALAACGHVVRDQELMDKLAGQGYGKVIIQPQRFSCGRFGTGKHFLATAANGHKVVGQICYKLSGGVLATRVAVNHDLTSPMVRPPVSPGGRW